MIRKLSQGHSQLANWLLELDKKNDGVVVDNYTRSYHKYKFCTMFVLVILRLTKVSESILIVCFCFAAPFLVYIYLDKLFNYIFIGLFLQVTFQNNYKVTEIPHHNIKSNIATGYRKTGLDRCQIGLDGLAPYNRACMG